MAAEQFCLRWNNFQTNIASALGSLKAEEDLVDVTLTCGGQSVKAHKVILSACSPYFRSVFKENPCQHPVVILKDVRYDDVLALLSFMYQGEVFITQDQLSTFLETAELLQVRGLTGAASPVKESPVPKSNQMPPLAPPPLNSLLQKNFPKSPSGSGALRVPSAFTLASAPVSSVCKQTHAKRHAGASPCAPVPVPAPAPAPSPGHIPALPPSDSEHVSAPSSPQPQLPPIAKRRKAVPRRVSTSSLASSDTSSAPEPSQAQDSLALLEHVSVNLAELKQEPADAHSDSVPVDGELKEGMEDGDGDGDGDGEVYNDHDGEDHDNDEGAFYMEMDEGSEAGTSSLLARSLAGVAHGHGSVATNNQTSATDLTAGGDGPKGGSVQCGTCPHCGQNYSNLSALKYHVRLVHSDLTNRLCCHLCPRSFVQREQYRQHMWDKHGTRN